MILIKRDFQFVVLLVLICLSYSNLVVAQSKNTPPAATTVPAVAPPPPPTATDFAKTTSKVNNKSGNNKQAAPMPVSAASPASNLASIHWLDVEDAVLKNQKNPKKVLIFFDTPWCGWCKKMMKTTLQDTDVVNYLNQKYYTVQFNAESTDTITIDGQEFKPIFYNKRVIHELAIALLQQNMSFPSTVILDADLTEISIAPGYLETNDFAKMLVYFGEGHDKKGVAYPDFKYTPGQIRTATPH
jgi:thioredoxin-related protein